jgi:hypothetical protein
MELRLFKTLWGHDGDLLSAIELAREAGFTGIEGPVPSDDAARAGFFQHLAGTPWIAEVSTCTPEGEYLPVPDLGVAEHLKSLEEGILRSLPGDPLFVTTMAGSDAWGLDDTLRFHEGVLRMQEKLGITISIETHRGRPTFNPWRTAEILDAFPGLRLTCDFSHWCVVTERLILDEETILLDKLAGHAHHIHGRVGYAQGPQVPDPRAPEHAGDLAAHERWWDVLLASMESRGTEVATFTPESGPDGYLHCIPFTRVPVADLWDINRWLGRRQLQRKHLL